MDCSVQIDANGVLTDFKTTHMAEVLNKTGIFELRDRYRDTVLHHYMSEYLRKRNDHREFARYSLTCNHGEDDVYFPTSDVFMTFLEYPHLAELHIACYDMKDVKNELKNRVRHENNFGWRNGPPRPNVYLLNAKLKQVAKEFDKVWLRYETYRRLVAYELKSLVIPR